MKITDSMIKKSCSGTIYKRGLEYFNEGRVHIRKREDNMITAIVDGEELYNVQIQLSDKAVEGCFCTCPYFETMNSVCKHIVATLKERQKELDTGVNFNNENDAIAKSLCNDFASITDYKNTLHAQFILHITQNVNGGPNYAISMSVNGAKVHGIENFLDCYLRGEEFKFNKDIVYSQYTTQFPPSEDKIISILAESYECRSSEKKLYIKETYQASFGSLMAKRIFPILENVDFAVIFDGINIHGIHTEEGNPDIIIDIIGESNDITLSISDRGFSLTNDGEWFLYESVIYHTDREWRNFFMPIYNALATESRTQITFRGDNTLLFAMHVLPNIKNKHGVITSGIDDIIVNTAPTIDIFLDSADGNLKAVIRAKYGNISIMLPDANSKTNNSDKIVVRDFDTENDILSYFDFFTLRNGAYTTGSDSEIYIFLTQTLPKLENKATLHYSENFEKLNIRTDSNITLSVAYNEKIDLLETSIESDLSPDEINAILRGIKLHKDFFRLDNNTFIDLESTHILQTFKLLEQFKFSPEDIDNGRKLLPKYNSLYINALDTVDKRLTFIDYVNKIRSLEPVIPDELSAVLRPYQIDGIAWFTQLAGLGLGGILADDMGLGKTLQVIAYIHGIKPTLPTLIIAPSTLTYNWLSEIKKFTPDAKSIVIDGTAEERERLLKTIDDYEFVITSYALIRRDIEMYEPIKFSYCFADEAQQIKNPRSVNARSIKTINAEHKFALTGTPIENTLSELWSIFDFAMPGYLGSYKEFRMRYENPLLHTSDSEILENLKIRTKPFMLRRMKCDVLNELPEKIENTMYAELSEEQKNMYLAHLALAKNKTLRLLNSGGSGKIQILTLLMRLRQICCHPSLFDADYKDGSGKLELLVELVTSAIESGHRLLIFSQFTSMLEIINRTLRRNKIDSFYLDGQTPSAERTELADKFNNGEKSVFLISLKAGGVGLNLTGADMVIHYDPWWNPAVTDQASDRAYRIGQKKAVQVIRLATRDTIEEKILKLQDNKKSLAEDIIQVNEDAFKMLSNDELLSLFD